jgi:hypothetical protein
MKAEGGSWRGKKASGGRKGTEEGDVGGKHGQSRWCANMKVSKWKVYCFAQLI